MIEADKFLYLLNPWNDLAIQARIQNKPFTHPGHPDYRPRPKGNFYKSGGGAVVRQARQMGYEAIPFKANPAWPSVVSLSLTMTQAEVLIMTAMTAVNIPSENALAAGVLLFGHEVEVYRIVHPNGSRRLLYTFPHLRWENYYNPNPVFATGV
jgi:hypothetical protein